MPFNSLRCCLACAALLASGLAAVAATFTNDTLVSFNNTNFEGQEIVVSNCTLTVDGSHGFASVHILSGGTLTHTFSTNGLLEDRLSIAGESHVLSDTNPPALNQTNVLLDTLVVMDFTSSITYTQGSDYALLTTNGVTWINRLPGSTIQDGDTILASYSALGDPISTGLNLVVTNNVEIEAGGGINVMAKGYGSGFGPGAGASHVSYYPYFFWTGGGGGYGGYGGAGSNEAAGGKYYGSIVAPGDKGSGGGAGLDSGGAGGGAVKLVVGGLLRVDGQITANGASAVSPYSGGGSGGMIWVSALVLSGAGSISADGGAGDLPDGGGGGGGRIAIYCSDAPGPGAGFGQFFGSLSARGGAGAACGGAGTIYTSSGSAAPSQLLVDNGGQRGGNTALAEQGAFDLTISGGAVVQPTMAQQLSRLLIDSNSWLTCSRGQNSLSLVVNGDATIVTGGGITVDGQGYSGNTGLGAGHSLSVSNTVSGSGGGYGGGGGASASGAAGGSSYGSTSSPVDPGSGGGNGSGTGLSYLGGSGGGALQLTVNGTLAVDGRISADGVVGPGRGSGGGSGGSVWVTASKLVGAGVISANGGSGELPLGGGGGGGRIALYCGTNEFAGNLSAHGGQGAANGGAGTVYTKANGSTVAQIVIDNSGWSAGSNTFLSTFSGVVDLTIRGGAVVIQSSGSPTIGNLLIGSNSWFTFPVSQYSSAPLSIRGNATIQAGGGILLDGIGSAPGTGQGAGRSSVNPYGQTIGGGGGYGGYGGAGLTNAAGGNTYGPITEPNYVGSGGGNGSGNFPYNLGGAGGGALYMIVTGALIVDGKISANGIGGVGQGSGGGSGGSIWLRSGNFSGAGLICADGGPGDLPLGGGGGGGRIAIYCTSNGFTGRISACGGAGANYGGAGTIFSQSSGQAGLRSLITIDNGGRAGTNTPLSTLYGYNSYDLTVSGGAQAVVPSGTTLPTIGTLLISSNSWLTSSNLSPVRLTFTVLSNATIRAGGGILLDGQGYAAGQGPGAGAVYGGGGGYGGCGAIATNQTFGGGSYGSISSPTDFGSGGANGAYSQTLKGGLGGGALQMTVRGTLQLDGRISADGTTGLGQGSGGGSGGSVWLTVGKLTGAGAISAKGGVGDAFLGGGGGGGRIALSYSTNQFAGSISASGGAGAGYGGAGTIYLQNTKTQYNQIIVDNGGRAGANTPWSSGGDSFDLTISGGALVTMSGTYGLDESKVNNLLIASNSWLSYTSSLTYALPVFVNNATIQAGGGISLDGAGSAGGLGQGAGHDASGPFGLTGGGGGHGGSGGISFYGGAGGISYDLIAQPSTAGSGGGNGSSAGSYHGGSGGGVLQITISGALQLDGRISADGAAGLGQSSGGGSGGSLWLTVGKITGAGLISANGGSADLPFGGGGGGGRIALYYGTNQFTGSFSARGGPGAMFGGPGTVYLSPNQTNSSLVAQLIVDNGGWSGGSSNTFLTVTNSLDLAISGGAVVDTSATSIRSLLIGSNSWLSLSPAPTKYRTLTVTSNATIQASGGITLNGRGYASGMGTGAGRSLSSPVGFTGGGGGYGGYGGSSSYGAAGGIPYGYLVSPTDPGSGGGSGNGGFPYAIGGSGGGALKLTVNGTLTLDGKISADGTAGPGQGSGGGSGGSLWLLPGKLSGAGMISANGGAGDPPYGGGGGGGRISISPVTTNQFTGIISARGGPGATYGGAGTIYISAPKVYNAYAQVLVDNGGYRGTNTDLGGDMPYNSVDLTVSGGAVLGLTSFGGTPYYTGSLHNLLITSNAWITCPGFGQRLTLNLTATGDATIQAGGGINMDAKGYLTGLGAGVSTNDPFYGLTAGGGGYGGCGGASLADALGGSSYGSLSQPIDPGSGSYSVQGGGSVKLTVSRNLVLDGTISANGASAVAEGGGGGSGGSIWLTVGTLLGAGRISADGGQGDYLQGGGGGGGRIAVYYSTNQFAGSSSARGGAGAVYGGAGTIYSKAKTSAVGQVLVDNGGWLGTNTPLAAAEAFNLTVSGGAVVNPSSPTLVLGSLLVDSGAMLTHLSTQTNLDLTVLGNAAIGTNGSIVVDGRGYNGPDGGPGAGQMTNNYSGSGGGYGGVGGAGISGIPGGLAYGSAQQPVDRGSRGGLFPLWTNFCEGGGAVRMRVGGTLTLHGSLTANGSPALLEGAGGGAGGSIWLTARQFEGDGLVMAEGGPGDPIEGGGGGGGRIAIYCRTNHFGGAITADGGDGASRGANGTVYLATNIPAPQVIAQSPTDVLTYAVSNVDLTFDSPINSASASPSDATLFTPYEVLPQSSITVSALNLTTLRVSFPAQSSLGYYELWFGPGVEDIYGDSMADTYIGSFALWSPIISGRVTDTNGLPVPYVTLRPSDGLTPTLTDKNGFYSLDVLPSWTGSITPSRTEWVFIPASRSYTNVSANVTNQNFLMASPATLNLTQEQQGTNMTFRWFGINGVTYQRFYSPDLVNWWPYDVPLSGTNGPLLFTVPVGNEPMGFFRFEATFQ